MLCGRRVREKPYVYRRYERRTTSSWSDRKPFRAIQVHIYESELVHVVLPFSDNPSSRMRLDSALHDFRLFASMELNLQMEGMLLVLFTFFRTVENLNDTEGVSADCEYQ